MRGVSCSRSGCLERSDRCVPTARIAVPAEPTTSPERLDTARRLQHYEMGFIPALRSQPASVPNAVERERRLWRRCLRSAAPTRDQHDGSPRLTQIHSTKYENESATATS